MKVEEEYWAGCMGVLVTWNAGLTTTSALWLVWLPVSFSLKLLWERKKSPFMEEHCSTILLHRLLPGPQQLGYKAMFPRTMCDRVPNILQHQL